ncbi:MAG: M50 family metallopeptidase [Acidimicrobiales bacterium]
MSPNAWAVARLGAVLAAIAAAFWIAGLGALLLFIVALVVMVVFHELGHFLTAKWSGMKVTEYFIGFGPRLWSIRRGETDYGVKPILAGAYVKIPGMTNLEQVDPADEPRTYRQKPFRNRVLVASAGSIMHYVMAFVLAWVAVVTFGVPSRTQVQVAGFVKWSGHSQTAAQAAGLRAGERILSVDGTAIGTTSALSSAIQATRGRPATVVVTQRGRQRTLVVRPQAGHTVTAGSTVREVLGPSPNGKKDWLIGIVTQGSPLFTAEAPVRAVGTAAIDMATVTKATVVGIAHVFSPGGVGALFNQVTSPQAAARASANPAKSQRVGSIVQAGQLAVDAEHHGVYYFLSVLIALSIVLGLMNMLPMLPLDGGHVVIALYERVRTRRGRPYYQADVAKLLPVAYAFMAVLVVVVGSAVFLDIAHPVANPFGY